MHKAEELDTDEQASGEAETICIMQLVEDTSDGQVRGRSQEAENSESRRSSRSARSFSPLGIETAMGGQQSQAKLDNNQDAVQQGHLHQKLHIAWQQ